MSTESGSVKRAFDELGSGSVSALSGEQRDNPGDEQEVSTKKRKANNKERDVKESELLSALANGENEKNCQFRLEAIFLPKFDNEHRTDQSIRKEIKERVSAGQGFAEVTLKHSGSLLLWSGGQRFYSKNSANNQVTCVGEILLRQHFYRVSSQLHQKKQNEEKNPEWVYQKCSDYVEKNRLTLAFEVVTSVLGDHAAVPSRDFLILTAVADRSHRHGRFFYSTSELLELAQELYLPHNDTWVFRSEESLKQLFDLYVSSREIGMADTIIPALTHASEARIVSIYPHHIFHSNILEGFVIRYVSHVEASKSSDSKVQLDAISEKAKQFLDDISPELPPCYELARSSGRQVELPPILSVNVRDIFSKVREAVRLTVALNDNSVEQSEQQDASTQPAEASHPTARSDIPHIIDSSSTAIKGKFEMELRELLWQKGPRRIMQRVGSSLSDDIQSMLPSYCAGLRTQKQSNVSVTDETKQIAGVIQTLADLGERVQYSIFRERESMSGADKSSKSHSRWLCMVHIYFDKTFQRYRREQRNQKPRGAMMDLFRGFCVELALEKDSTGNAHAADTDAEATTNKSSQASQEGPTIQASAESTETSDEDISCNALLLKMKFLPYMVRTFGCRNGIRYVRDGGPDRFNKYARDLLTVHWQVSLEATQTWMPYLQAWGEYVHACLSTSETASKKQRIKTLESPPLSEDCYLEHLKHFEAQYFETRADSASQSSFDGLSEPTSLSRQSTANPIFRGLAIVLALNANSAENAAAFIAKEWLHGAKRLEGGTEAINHEDMLLYCTPGIGGRVCCGAVGTEKVRKVRMLPEVDKTYISLVLVGLSDEEIKASVSEGKDQRRLIGQTSSWRKSKCGAVISLPAAFTETSATSSGLGQKVIEDARSKIWEISRSIPELDTRPGLLVFFPASIPGCGKSTIVGGDTELKLQETLTDIVRSTSSDSRHQSVMRPRKFSVLVGDQQQKRVKFWSMVKEKRLQNSSTVSIADKNVPLSSWEKVGQVCASTNGKAVAVIPAGFGVLQTTYVEGARKPDGSFDAEKHHYPFSLHYLAVCMARVLEREPGTHLGKLDKGSAPFAMMIVVKFFTLYRGITSQNFLDSLNEKLSQAGGLTTSTPVDLPFFEGQNFQELPNDLEQVLLEALKAKRGWDLAKVDVDKNLGEGEYIKELEAKLRNTIRKHRKLLFNMTVSESVSRKVFVSQVVQRVLEVEGRKSSSCEFIKIASIDIPRASIHSLLRGHISIETDLMEGRLHRDSFVDGEYRGCEYVKNTHITLAHFTQLSQTQLRAMFESILGQQVVVQVKGLLWSQRIAALLVNVPLKTRGGKDVPRPQNSFQHITLWHKQEVSPSESNDLPQHLASGEAHQMLFAEELTLTGTISFWRIDQH